MLKIKLDDYDKLHSLVTEISSLAYLMDLSYSYYKSIQYDSKLDNVIKHIDSYLIDKQCKAVSMMLELLDRKDFAISDKKSFSETEKLP
ncbi:MAG: hypothetical protein IJB24_08170 [Clostridia bacterium]|nr:hypothetical protein [Clostridia bacterium]